MGQFLHYNFKVMKFNQSRNAQDTRHQLNVVVIMSGVSREVELWRSLLVRSGVSQEFLIFLRVGLIASSEFNFRFWGKRLKMAPIIQPESNTYLALGIVFQPLVAIV